MKQNAPRQGVPKLSGTYPVKIFLFVLLFLHTPSKSNATAWTTATAGDITVLTNWTDGTTSPTTFATPGDTWTINQVMTITPSGSWVVGAAATTADTVTFATGGALNNTTGTGATTANITIYGEVVISGGALAFSGTGGTEQVYIYGDYSMSAGTISASGSGESMVMNIYGFLNTNGGTISDLDSINVYGNDTVNGGSISSINNMIVNGACYISDGSIGNTTTSFVMNMSVNGDCTVSGTGVINNAGGTLNAKIHGNYAMTDGVVSTSGSGSHTELNVYGNYSMSGPAKMTCAGSGATDSVHLCLPTASGTMLIDNTSTGTWTGTDIMVDAGCTARLDDDFSATTNSGVSTTSGFGFIVSGTLICPAAYTVNGQGSFRLKAFATLKVAHATGINGAITTTGTKSLNAAANYTYNGTVAQVTGSLLPVSLGTPDSIVINNTTGVTLTNATTTTGTLLFGGGILHTGGFSMTVPGDATAVVGAGGNKYVDGTFIKTITGLSAITYEVGDLSYAPMILTFDAPGTGGSLGLMATNGLHPSVGSSGLLSTNMVNHYWTITDYSSAGPNNVTPTGYYALSDILGGSNATFLTEEFTGTGWLSTPLATTNTASTSYTSEPNAGIPVASVAGDYIFGSDCTTLPITGSPDVCVGSTTTLSDATISGSWSSSNTLVATVSATGDVYGVAAGTAVISYTVGCPATLTVIVGTLPISGTTTFCSGSVSALSDATPGGVWSSDNSTVATVSATGVVTGSSAGTANISYAFGSCAPVGTMVTIITLGGISGTPTTCIGSATALSNTTTGGTWSSSNTLIATVSNTGSVTGVSGGVVTIIYAVGGCSTNVTVTVNTFPIVGATTICNGATTTLTDETTGGVWSSSNTLIATVSTTGDVTGMSGGSATISYTAAGCAAVTLPMTVVTVPGITGNTTLCVGSTTGLTDATGGGTWSSGNTLIATVSGTGIVTGVSGGSTDITYTVGSCFTTISVNVNGTLSPITGTLSVCVGSTTALTDNTAGGTWSSDNTGVAPVSGAGVVTGMAAGTAIISYGVGGCSVGATVTVSDLSAIGGPTTVCAGSTITLSNSTTGGVWSSSNSSTATVSNTGVVSGVSSGTVIISYTSGPCSVGTSISVGSPISGITGNTTVCVGATTTLSDATPGGSWSSDNNAIATISGTGVVLGVSPGTATISYGAGACSVTADMTVLAASAGTITGADSICVGVVHAITLTDDVSGGVWSSSNTSRAVVDPTTGVVTGISSGTFTITYTVTNSCGTFIVTHNIAVRSASRCATGVEPVAVSPAAGLKVFPNPNGGTFTMNLLSDENETVQVVITNVVGEKVSELTTTTNKVTDIKLTPAAGVYLLSASTAHNRYVTKVVVY